MVFMIRTLSLVCTLLLLGGCIFAPSLDSGNPRLDARRFENQLNPGVTTSSEVLSRFGPPQEISRPAEMSRRFDAPHAGIHPAYPDAEIWTYSSSVLRHTYGIDPRAVSYRQLTLRLFFDHQGVLRDYTLRETRN